MGTRILAVNAAGRKKGTTTRLVQEALEGAASRGAETEMLLLCELDLQHCRNCLKCYRDLESPLAPCTIKDDATTVLEKVSEADGVIFASPVHNGHVSAHMVSFLERLVWRMCAPTGDLMGLKGVPKPRTDKVRAVGTIASAGGMPDRLRKFCDGTPWLKENVTMFLNGHWVGDIYAAAHLEKIPETEKDWQTLYFSRRLSERQLREARELGIKVADAACRNELKATPPMDPLSAALGGLAIKFMTLYKLADKQT